jgi:hypothetical protein
MIVVLLVGGGLGVLHRVRTARIQRAAVAAIDEGGGYVFYDCDRDPKRIITVRGLTYHKGTPKGQNMPGLRPPARVGIDYFNNVIEIVLPGFLSDAELALVGRFPRVEKVWHAGPSRWVTDAGLAHLDGLASLTDLDLSHTNITDAGLVHLKAMKSLQQLNLCRTQVTDAGLVHLSGLTSLQRLDLRGTDVGGTGVVHLQELTGLRLLDLRGTDVDEVAAAELRRTLPHALVLVKAPSLDSSAAAELKPQR